MAFTILQAEFINFFCEVFLFGVYSVLVLVTVFQFVSRGRTRSIHTPLLAMTVVMYILSAVRVVIFIIWAMPIFSMLTFNAVLVDDLIATQVFIDTVNIIFADSIIIWRVWTVWQRNYYVVAVPSISFLGTIIVEFFFAHSFLNIEPGGSNLQGSLSTLGVAAAALVLTTNLSCTGLIAGRIWYMQNVVEGNVLPESRLLYRRVILMILESGFTYSAAWVVLLALISIKSVTVYIFYGIISSLTGIVPTVIVLLSITDLLLGSEVEQQYSTNLNFRSGRISAVDHAGRGAQTTRRSSVLFTTSHNIDTGGGTGTGTDTGRDSSGGGTAMKHEGVLGSSVYDDASVEEVELRENIGTRVDARRTADVQKGSDPNGAGEAGVV